MSKLFKCPHCGVEQDVFGEAITQTQYLKRDVETGDILKEYEGTSESEYYYCLECNEIINDLSTISYFNEE